MEKLEKLHAEVRKLEEHYEWAEQQEFNLIEKVQSYGDSKEYTLNINGVRFAVSSYYDFEKDFIDLITKHRL